MENHQKCAASLQTFCVYHTDDCSDIDSNDDAAPKHHQTGHQLCVVWRQANQ